MLLSFQYILDGKLIFILYFSIFFYKEHSDFVNYATQCLPLFREMVLRFKPSVTVTFLIKTYLTNKFTALNLFEELNKDVNMKLTEMLAAALHHYLWH